MKKEIKKNQKIVAMVSVYPAYHGYKPYWFNFQDTRINGIRPCIQNADGSLVDMRTDEPVALIENASLWEMSPGTVFEYPDGLQLLISRKLFEDRALLVLEIDGDVVRFSQTSMVLHKVRDYVEKETKS